MKKIIYISFILISFLISCDLDTEPTDMVSSDKVLGTANQAKVAFNGAWSYLFETYFTYANPGYTTILRTSDAMGNDVAMLSGKYGYQAPYLFTELRLKTAYRTRSIWTLLYKTINNTNAIIAFTNENTGSDAQQKKYAKGQAYALRAFCYLNLVQFYQFSYQKDKTAKAIPIYTDPTISADVIGKPCATVEQVYTFILDDLMKALSLLDGFNRGSDKFRPNTNVANGLLARTYLNMGMYNKAAEHAALAGKGIPLMTTDEFASGFNDISIKECMWGHAQSPNQSVASYTFNYLDQVTNFSYYKSVRPDPNLMLLHSEGDIRKSLYIWGEFNKDTTSGSCLNRKFRFRPDITGDIILMRAAEMLLIEAESLVEINKIEEGVAKLNELRQARLAQLFDKAGKSKQEIIDTILLERRKELWGEGFSLSDILRRQLSVERKTFEQFTGSPYIFIDFGKGNIKKITVKNDHWALNFPDIDKTNFTPNSRYYLFAISDDERRNNPNLNRGEDE